jgi:EcoRII C terminal
MSVSLSIQNRRKSRVGLALENHLEAIFKAYDLRFDRGKMTENKSKPDFLFPGANEYANLAFPAGRLTMLGSKSTSKDRWRQVLSEADRISPKHLVTLEPGISQNQTDEMQARQLQLVIPARLHETYRPAQRDWLMTMRAFVELVRHRQIL